MRTHSWIASWFLLLPLAAQAAAPTPEPKHYEALEWRGIGPFRGGRVAAVCGVRGQPDLVWFGGTGGGVWKSGDGGRTFDNVSDGFFGGSIGAVAVAESDPNVVYVGGGEKTVRGNVSHGSGLWKSLDAGKTWTHLGMADAHHIPRVRVHPRDPDLVYVAVLGHLHGPGEARGVFRSRDGGRTFEALAQPAGPVTRLEWPGPALVAAGGAGVRVSEDGGQTWRAAPRGLPEGLARALAVSSYFAVDPVMFAGVENAGVQRTTDGGRTWAAAGLSGARVNDLVWLGPILYAAADSGLFQSHDNGAHWTRLGEGLGEAAVTALLFPLAPASGAEFFAGTDRGIFHTLDGGLHFARTGFRDEVSVLATFPPPDPPRRKR